jgi:hypothetical protein
LETEPTRLPTFPVERGFNSVALDHHDDFLSWIPEPVTFEEQADLRLHPFDLLANGHVATPDHQNPDMGVVGLALDLANVEARPRQVLGELDMEEHATHAVLGQESF